MSEVGLKLKKLGELVEIHNNKRIPLSSKERANLSKIYPYYGAQGIVDYVDNYIFDGKNILIAEDGENLKSNNKSICTLATGKYWVNNHAHIVRANNENDTDYLFYKLNSISFLPYITGSAQPKLNKENLLNIPVYVHEKAEQKNISKLLSKIDQKIALNNQINEELEAMAKTLYDYWFVQFDFPDQNGKPYKSSGGKMVYHPELKREIPEGWGVESVGNLLDKVTKAEKIENNSIEFIGEIPVIDQSQKYIAGFTNNENAILQPQDGHVIFGDHTRVVKYINFDYARGADGTQVLISNNENISNVLLYHMIEDFDLSNYGYARHFKFLKEKTVIVPDKEVSSKFETQANVIYEKIKNNIFENQELTQLRDWLLPMLMNGQVKVEDKT